MTDVAHRGLSADEAEHLAEFLELLQAGRGELNAGIAVGWTPYRTRQLMQDPEFAMLVRFAEDRQLEDAEWELAKLVKKGHFPAIQMTLYCKGADRGWRPPQQRVAVNHGGQVQVERVHAVRQAAAKILAEHGVEALAAGGPLGMAVDDEIVDAEVVE